MGEIGDASVTWKCMMFASNIALIHLARPTCSKPALRSAVR